MDDLSKFFRRLFEEICIVSPLISSFGHMELHKYCLLMHNRLWHWPLLVESIYAGFSNQIRRMAMLSNFSFLAETTTVSVVRKPHFAFKNVSDSDAIIGMESRISRNVNLNIVLRSSSWSALQHLNRTNWVILVIVNLLDHSNHHVRHSFAIAHDRGGGEKKRRVFPRKAEFGASVASSFVQPATPHPPDGEGLGPLWFAPKTTEIWVREKIESYGRKPAKKQVSWNDLCLG